MGISISEVFLLTKSLKDIDPSIVSPKEIIKLIWPSSFKSVIWDTFSEEVIIAFALQSFTTYFISFGVNIVFTGFITAPTLAIPK